MQQNTITFGGRFQFLIGLLLLLSLLTANPVATMVAVVFLPISARLLYRKNEPPFLFFAIALQWLQVTVKIFYADAYGMPFSGVFEFQQNIEQAYYTSLAGLLAISFGIWLVLRNMPVPDVEDYQQTARAYNVKWIIWIYVIFSLSLPFLRVVGNSSGGFQQFFEKLITFNWTLFFIFYLVAIFKKEHVKTFTVILTIQVLLSFTGFYSSFKEYFMFLMLGYLTINQKIRFKQLVIIGFVGIIGFNFFVVWSHIKPEYRSYLNRHGGKVDASESLDKLSSLVNKMDTAAYRDGLTRLIDRTSYIDYISATMQYVPKSVPHENGKLWWLAVTHVFTPRILFPNKPVIDDSKLAAKYTGLAMYGAEHGTSISLGYMGESYVDFGPYLLLVPLLLFGAVIGLMYRFVCNSAINVLWGIALVLPLFFQVNLFEQSLIKMVGGAITYLLVLVILKRFGVFNYVDKRMKLVRENKDVEGDELVEMDLPERDFVES